MSRFLIWLIAIYQRYISPYKGFCCAHAYLHQGDSCSVAVKNIIADQGIIKGYADIRQRFQDCRYAYEDIQKNKEKEREEQEEEEKNKKKKSDSSCDCNPIEAVGEGCDSLGGVCDCELPCNC